MKRRLSACDHDECPPGRCTRPEIEHLVVLDLPVLELNTQELFKIDQLDWYRPDIDKHPEHARVILVDGRHLRRCLDAGRDLTDPADVGLSTPFEVEPILRVLHRYDIHTGFYHA